LADLRDFHEVLDIEDETARRVRAKAERDAKEAPKR
jgi:hypothetical protein